MKNTTTRSDLLSKSISELVKSRKPRPGVRQCSNCGKMFYSLFGYSICDDCKEKVSDEESDVRDYVMKHHNATVSEVTENLGVTTELIQRMLDEGKLQLRETGVVNRCKSCGTPIVVGNYCQKCLARMRNQIETAKKNILSHMNQQGHLNATKLQRTTGDKIRTDFHLR